MSKGLSAPGLRIHLLVEKEGHLPHPSEHPDDAQVQPLRSLSVKKSTFLGTPVYTNKIYYTLLVWMREIGYNKNSAPFGDISGGYRFSRNKKVHTRYLSPAI